MRARYKERFDTANLRHKEWEIACTFACLATAAAQHHAWHCPARANRSSDMMRCPYRHFMADYRRTTQNTEVDRQQ